MSIIREQIDANLRSIVQMANRISTHPVIAACIRDEVQNTQQLLDALPKRVPFGHLYRISLGADHIAAQRPWASGSVFAFGPAPFEGHRGDIEYKNLYEG